MSSPTPRTYYEIQRDRCVTIWYFPENSLFDVSYPIAITRDFTRPASSHKHESDMLLRINQIICKLDRESVPFSVPKWHAFFGKEDDHERKERHQIVSRVPRTWLGNALVAERLPSFPEEVRHKLFYLCCPDDGSDEEDVIYHQWVEPGCMIRPYLGKRRKIYSYDFTIASGPLYIEQMEQAGLDVELYSRIMAETLSIFYWAFNLDAHKIKFVLAPARSSEEGIRSEFLGKHAVWVPDLKECQSMSITRRDVERAVWAFLMNQPFCPRPGMEDARDQKNWSVFREAFARKSRELLEEKNFWLADLWIEKVEAWGSNNVLD